MIPTTGGRAGAPATSKLRRRAAPNLFCQELPDATEDAALSHLLQIKANLPAEQRSNALANELERQTVAPKPGNQLSPQLVGTYELLGSQQLPRLIDPQTCEGEDTHRFAAEHSQFRWFLSAG